MITSYDLEVLYLLDKTLYTKAMAFFLLIYVLFVLAWVLWISVLVWHVFKYRFPNDTKVLLRVGIFLTFSAIILLISFFLISRADWTQVPPVLKALDAR